MSYSSEVLADSPVAYWRLGESSGTTAVDSSGNGRDGTYANTPTLGAASLVASDADTAMQVAANSGQRVSLPHAAWMNLTQLTVECLVKVTSAVDTGNGDAIVSCATSSGWRWLLWRDTGGHWACQLSEASGATRSIAGSATSVAGTTYHLAMTYNGSALRLYVDGVEVAAFTGMAGGLWSGTAPLEIGRYSVNDATTPGAVIDEVAIYGSALSATRIAAHHDAAIATGPAEVTGSLAAVLPGLTGSLSGGIEFTGTISAVLPPLGANLSGTSQPPGVGGDLIAVLPQLGASLAGAYSDTATLAAVLPPLAADLSGTYTEPPVTGTLAATLPNLSANIAGQAFEPGTSGFLAAVLPALSASFAADVLGRTGLGIGLDSDAVLTVVEVLEPEPSVPAGTPPTVLHVIAPTVPVPTLVAGRPQ